MLARLSVTTARSQAQCSGYRWGGATLTLGTSLGPSALGWESNELLVVTSKKTISETTIRNRLERDAKRGWILLSACMVGLRESDAHDEGGPIAVF